MKNKNLFWTIGIIVVILIVGMIYFNNQKKEGETVKIGVILPLTGNGASYGIWGRNALEIAKEEISF